MAIVRDLSGGDSEKEEVRRELGYTSFYLSLLVPLYLIVLSHCRCIHSPQSHSVLLGAMSSGICLYHFGSCHSMPCHLACNWNTLARPPFGISSFPGSLSVALSFLPGLIIKGCSRTSAPLSQLGPFPGSRSLVLSFLLRLHP